jgi:segregation and condensation protein A
MLDLIKTERSMSFEKIFEVCDDRIHAIFLFLNILELVQLKYMTIITGNGTNNFIIEYNEDRIEEENNAEEKK